MKKLALSLLVLLFPAMLFAQYQVKLIHLESQDLTVTIPGYNERIPAAVMNIRFTFDQENNILLATMNKGLNNPNYNKIWLPQNDFDFAELNNYMKSRGVKTKKAQTFVDQENFLGLGSKKILASIATEGMTFNGLYDLKSPKKVKKQLDHQMVPLDGVMELNLAFTVEPTSNQVKLTLRNPIPMDRSGSKGTLAYVAENVIIDIVLDRCFGSEEKVATIKEYESIFRISEDKLIELKKSPSTMRSYKDFILKLYNEIDIDRFANAGCDEIQESYDELMACIDRINEMGTSPSPSSSSTTSSCDVKSLNAEIKSTTTKLNNLVNDWSLAPDAAAKAEKKAAFDAAVQRFDAKLNDLPSGCKAKLDAKLLKNYEFVKKLVK